MRTGEQKTASVFTLGCRLNQSETAVIVEKLREHGYAIVPFGEPADLGIINTCTVTAEADAKARKATRSFIRKNPNAFMAVIGCYSQGDYEAVAAIKGVDLILGNQDKLNVLDHVTDLKNTAPVVVRNRMDRGDFAIETARRSALGRRANLKVQDGCDFMCSFCIVPFVRGRARSRAMDNLLDEARLLVDRGVKEIVLTGVNIGAYDYQGRSLVDVVDRLDAIAGLDRLRLSSTEPTTILEALFARMNAPDHTLVPYLHIPIQSGSNAVLAAMKRRYTREDLIAFVGRAASVVRDLCIGTDVLVGFPGEGDAEFEDTCRLIEEYPIAYAHVFKYSERMGTPAARLLDKVDPAVLNRRSARMRRIGERKRRRFHKSCLGRALDVLFEEKNDGYWYGYTPNFIRVAARSDEPLANVIKPVTLEKPCGDYVIGTIHDY